MLEVSQEWCCPPSRSRAVGYIVHESGPIETQMAILPDACGEDLLIWSWANRRSETLPWIWQLMIYAYSTRIGTLARLLPG